jgi:predicted amidohydrolase
MSNKVRVVGVQMDCRILDKERNLQKCLEHVDAAAQGFAQLVIFPECILTGYIFKDLAEAIPMAETIPGPATEEISERCRRLNLYVVIGLLEKDGDKYYNSAALIGPGGLVGKHRKAHLPGAGVDKFLDHGDLPFMVHKTDAGRIGLGICFDGSFPEHARVLALQGAEIVILPAAWPEGIESFPKFFVPTRAIENHVFYAAVNRVGHERGYNFIGRSKIAWWGGKFLAAGKPYLEDLLVAEIEPGLARQKRVGSGGDWVDHVAERRPEFYSAITEPNGNLPRRRRNLPVDSNKTVQEQ